MSSSSADQCLFKNDANEKKGTNGSKTGGNVLFSKKLKQSPENLPLMNGGLKMSTIIIVNGTHNYFLFIIDQDNESR